MSILKPVRAFLEYLKTFESILTLVILKYPFDFPVFTFTHLSAILDLDDEDRKKKKKKEILKRIDRKNFI